MGWRHPCDTVRRFKIIFWHGNFLMLRASLWMFRNAASHYVMAWCWISTYTRDDLIYWWVWCVSLGEEINPIQAGAPRALHCTGVTTWSVSVFVSCLSCSNYSICSSSHPVISWFMCDPFTHVPQGCITHAGQSYGWPLVSEVTLTAMGKIS